MIKGTKFSIYTIFAAYLLFGSVDSFAQQAEGLLNKGDNLRSRYRFEESAATYRQALEAAEQQSDSNMARIIEDRILMAENGKSMTAFAYSPKVLARSRFSIDEFFLYYPLADRSWRPLPNVLDSAADHRFHKALYAPDGLERLYWSAGDEDGIRNLYTSSLQDSVWTVPALINEKITSVSDEIYPLLSDDGRHLYFSSAGLHGVGGYDLYVSDWDDEAQDWSAPENLGFPYSSPADDFLFYNTPDGRHTIFASNRGCSEDSVYVYVLAFDNMPVRRAVDSPDELMKIASLVPSDLSGNNVAYPVRAEVSENEDTRSYVRKMTQVKMLRDSISVYAGLIDSKVNAAKRINVLQDSLRKAQAELQKIELGLVMKGVVVDPEKLMAEAGEDVVTETRDYVFSKKEMGAPLEMKVLVPEVKFDYSFKILEEGQFAEDQNIPSGVVYQIQIFATKNKARTKDIKGLSPVYESRGANGHYVYRVGVFRTYNDVLSHLNAVKKVGFKSAYIVSFIDGKTVKLATAKAKEAAQKSEPVFYEVRVIPADGTLDPAVSSGIRQQAAGKDIARVQNPDGTTVYVVGPFSDKTKADSLVEFIRALGVSGVSSNKVK